MSKTIKLLILTALDQYRVQLARDGADGHMFDEISEAIDCIQKIQTT